MRRHPQKRPTVGIVCDVKQIGKHPFHCAGDKYVRAVLHGATALPVLLPSMGDELDVQDVLAAVDGLLFTGSPSNVAPQHYGSELKSPDFAQWLDPRRDATSLPLIRAAIAAGVPLLGICRGFQEINVALGGTLIQAVQEEAGKLDHRDDDSQPLDIQYGPAHTVTIADSGPLRQILGVAAITVNSLHQQGVERLASGLLPQAWAPDDLVEAFAVESAAAFALAVQWHPEWRFEENPASVALFAAFGDACRQRCSARANIP